MNMPNIQIHISSVAVVEITIKWKKGSKRLSPGSNYGSQASGSRGVVVIFTGEGVVDGHDSDW